MSTNKPTTLNEYGAGVQTQDDLHEDERLITACPECDVAHITPATKHTDTKWRCKKCGHKFDEPVMRQPRSKSTLTGLPAKLEAMDPAEVGD